ncbi:MULTISPECIES: ABC transporter permease [unclassified Rathayibacter]|uniref:ABC transporter permease n=1 Tax=unclassified Rathayibacter TaxID=2609250 RepID=UPI001FB25605|nr:MULTISPECIES: ABC transporter permease [unclassified Rathayibacter]MCJ1672033.1 ABC transporter permease [Rathayibacter sp. VKM Ac-2929]MCJ1683798.1 ABC transporter permease [Rathayibacter sp. VKM Ac-2928]
MSAVAAPRPALRTGVARTLRLGAARARYEVRSYFRAPDQVFFTFLFPVLLLAIFSVAFGDGAVMQANPQDPGISMAEYYVPGLAAAGILLSGVQNLGVDIAIERGDGTLKRLAGAPLPVLSYFLGKFGQVLVTSVAQTALLLAVAATVFSVPLPADGGRWATFAWIYLAGVATSAILGIAVSALPRTGKSATAVIVPPLLVLQFVSGSYLSFTTLPDWLQTIASVFPLKWIAQGMRAVFLPANFEQAEVNGDWDLTGVAIALGIWLVLGLIASRLTFRWIRRDA